jgi:CHAD domain-containing protein
VESGEVLFGAATDPGHVCDVLSAGYQVLTDAPIAARWIWLDTADWRLHKAGMTLRDTRRGRRGTLVLSDGAPHAITAPAPSSRWPATIDALPSSPVRDHVAPAIGVRALLPLAEVDVRSLTLRLVDGERKTRVRVHVDQQKLTGQRHVPLPLRVRVSPLRGYESDARRCERLLLDAIGRSDEGLDAAAAAFTGAGHTPGQRAVADVQLDPDAPAHQSVAAVLRHWIDVVDNARPGVLADIDTEYLHDMRAAARAARSLLQLAGDVIPEPRASRLVDDFTWLGRTTTPLRDLDVYLLELDGEGHTDVVGLSDLQPARRLLATKRRRALNTLRGELKSSRGLSVSKDVRSSIDDLTAMPMTGPATGEVAASLAQTAYRRIVKSARTIDSHTDPDELHRLRHRCKRMRYLLDSYSSVYAVEERRTVLAALKALQDCLGEIQDVDVQRRHTIELTAALSRRRAAPETLLAMGALHERNLQRAVAARRTMDRRLKRFCSDKTRRQVQALRSAPA